MLYLIWQMIVHVQTIEFTIFLFLNVKPILQRTK